MTDELIVPGEAKAAGQSPGIRQPCGTCGFPYVVRADGMMRFHHGVDAAGFSSGERCPGVGEPPRTA